MKPPVANPCYIERVHSGSGSHPHKPQEAPIDTFQTDRLTAERLRPDHLAEYRRLFQNARAMATLSVDGKPLSDEEVARWIRLGVGHWVQHKYGFWVFRTTHDGVFVGRAGLKTVPMEGRQEVELSYALLPEFWGEGLATEIARSVVKLAFEHFGMQELICYTLTTNRASQRVMEKAGFKFQKHIVHADLPHVLYRLHATEFVAKQEKAIPPV